MLTTLSIKKTQGKQAKTPVTLLQIHQALEAQGLRWDRTELTFHPDGSVPGSLKSLLAVARENPFLQPFFRQRLYETPGATPAPAATPWKLQTYAEAVADKNKKCRTYPFIEWTLLPDASGREETLRAIDAVLSKYPRKNYRYGFHAHFLGLQWGEGTLLELPDDYAKGPGPYLRGVTADDLRGVKWTHSHLRFGADRYAVSIVMHCLLSEAYNAADKLTAVPPAFLDLAQSLCSVKPKAIIRRTVISVQDSDDDYAKLSDEQKRTLDGAIRKYIISREQALYREVTGNDFACPAPAGDDAKEMAVYLMALGQAINQVRPEPRSFPIAKLRQLGASAMLAGTFSSSDNSLLFKPEDEAVPAESQRHEERLERIRTQTRRDLDDAAREGRLPHRLESYYFPEGVLYKKGEDADGKIIMGSMPNPNPEQTSYAAYHQIWVPEEQEVPASLQVLGYQRDSVRPAFDRMHRVLLKAYRDPAHALAYFKKAYIDGVECIVAPTDRESFNRRKILGAVFKPLGYQFVKQPPGSTGTYELSKSLSNTESVRCVFDFGSWRQTIECYFAYDNGSALPHGAIKFRMRLTGWSHPCAIDISSEALFIKAIENIGALAQLIEKDHIPELQG